MTMTIIGLRENEELSSSSKKQNCDGIKINILISAINSLYETISHLQTERLESNFTEETNIEISTWDNFVTKMASNLLQYYPLTLRF